MVTSGGASMLLQYLLGLANQHRLFTLAHLREAQVPRPDDLTLAKSKLAGTRQAERETRNDI